MKKRPSSTGRLFLIGGAADTVHKTLLELTGENSTIVLLPHASSIPDEVGPEVAAKLEALGHDKIEIIPALSNKEFTFPEDTGCIYALGGDQRRLVRKLGVRGRRIIKSFVESGGIFAGSSAGCACVGKKMITGGMADGVISTDSLEMATGLGLVSGLITDQHFRNRNRFNRLMLATSILSDTTGMGVDEDTAVLLDGNGDAQVLGIGQVTVFKRTAETSKSSSNIHNLNVSCYSPGTSFRLDAIQFQSR